ncbi:ATP-binding protein [Streptomyces sp. BRA346]|uniref:ATP-binding protein n=1 Tax=Streptomyces sp. BRA346 TaxID=2878199 RepID=UPI00406474DE
MAVTTARGAEILAERSLGSVAGPLPTVLEDLTLTITRPSARGHMDVAVVAGAWVGYLRRIGAAKLKYWDLSTDLDDAVLLISELVTNALKHGKGPEVGFRLIVGTDRNTDLVVMEVDDGSSGRPEVHDAKPDAESGRGMFLVASIANSWGVSEDGTKTWCALTAPASVRGAL